MGNLANWSGEVGRSRAGPQLLPEHVERFDLSTRRRGAPNAASTGHIARPNTGTGSTRYMTGEAIRTGLNILVAEDDAMIGMMLDAVLAGMGHTVCAIEATQSGTVAAAARCRPDLMIVDGRLGNGSGIAAVEEILRSGPIPHLFVSGDTFGILARNPRAIVVQKPFPEAELARAIQRALVQGGPRT